MCLTYLTSALIFLETHSDVSLYSVIFRQDRDHLPLPGSVGGANRGEWQRTDVFTPTWAAPLSAAAGNEDPAGAAAEPCARAAIPGHGLAVRRVFQSLRAHPLLLKN